MDDALAFRSALVGAGGCSFLGEITADYGDEAYTFTAACTTDDTGALSFSLTAPETIAGISGTVQSRGGKLTFDSTALAFGLLADGKVSPATAPYVVAESWRWENRPRRENRRNSARCRGNAVEFQRSIRKRK